MSWLDVLFGRGTKQNAKSRLEVMLIHDRGLFSEAALEEMEKEILTVVRKYAEIETGAAEIFVDKVDNARMMLSIRVPVRGQKSKR
ncbi:cell division topological specificity factor MinE [Coprothermobacteraceae bacterium]|nr:cell division topological specificity factor MinE [Coprothermobacteraceae bacterium]